MDQPLIRQKKNYEWIVVTKLANRSRATNNSKKKKKK